MFSVATGLVRPWVAPRCWSLSRGGGSCSFTPGKVSSERAAWRRLDTPPSESTKTFTVIREVDFIPTILMLGVVASPCSASWIFSRKCVGSSTRTFVCCVAECRSSTRAGRPRPVRAARVFGDDQDDCETTEGQLLPGLLTWVLATVLGVRLVTV